MAHPVPPSPRRGGQAEVSSGVNHIYSGTVIELGPPPFEKHPAAGGKQNGRLEDKRGI